MAKVDHIDADFGGERIRFELPRDRKTLKILEASGAPAYLLFQRFAAGAWSRDDIARILSLAYPGKRSYSTVPHVEKTISRTPYGKLVPLAVLVLEAHLFGVESERATFTTEAVS